MTEKRFIVDDCGSLVDMQTRDTFDYVSEVMDLLNEQHKTIRNLANELKELHEICAYYEDRIKELKEENEQLKKENRELEEFRYAVFKNLHKITEKEHRE